MARFLTLNIWQEQGPWKDRLAFIAKQVRELDVDAICLQEVREVPGRIPNQARTIADQLGMNCIYAAAQPWGDGEEGLAIITRRQVDWHTAVELPYGPRRSRRICLAARWEPLPGKLWWILNTHLAYRLLDGDWRERQILRIVEFFKSNVDGPVILAGDFNATEDSDEIRFLKGLCRINGEKAYFQDAYRTVHPLELGWTWTSENPYTESLAHFPRDRRLDYIFVSPQGMDGTAKIMDCRIVCSAPNSEGVWCSDHYGVLAEIEM